VTARLIVNKVLVVTAMSQLTQQLSLLNENQQQAVTHAHGPAVVLAGAGSGKTKVLTTHAAWLVQTQQVDPSNILLVTFTNKASNEMMKRIYQLTHSKLPYSGTFHGFCARILRQEGKAIGYDQDYLIYDSSDQTSLIKQIYKEKNINSKKFKPAFIKAVISTAKNNLLDVDEYASQVSNEFEEVVAKVYRVYQDKLLKQNAVDFDDLLFNSVTLFNHHPDILTKYQQQFVHVLIDEYQDTNKAQYQLTKQLAQPQNNVYVVGDFAQSIYAWRGADYRNLLHLKQDFSPVKEYRLEQNYRSTKPILAVATKLISNNSTHPTLKLWTNKTQGEPINVVETNSSYTESEFVIEQIRQLKKKYQYQDIAILYRVNAQSRAFEEYFVKAGIPYQVIGGFKFYERAEVKDILAYLRLIVNEQDSVSQERVIKLGKRRFERFQNWLQKKATKQRIDLEDPYELMKGILQSTGYLDRFDPKNPEDEERIENVQELLNVATQFKNTIIFLENVSLVQDEQMKDLPLAKTANRVSLMSFHSAKGLEFPVVFMVGLEEGLLPHSRSLYEIEKLEEERRLCYVGITRAKEQLYLTYATNRWLYGYNAQSSPSRFLTQLPSKNLVRKNYFGDLEQYTKDNKMVHLKSKNMINDSQYKKNSDKSSSQNYRLRIEVSEEELDALLNDELDIDDFLK